MLGLRYWLLPNIADYTGAVERALSRSIGERVTIGGIRAGWHGLRPELDLSNLRIHDRAGSTVLSLPGVDATVSWTSLALASIQFHSLVFDQPNLKIRRDAAGRIHVAGMELKGDPSGPDFSAWLLSQREIVIRNARLSWNDEQRAAPLLNFSGVALTLRNAAGLHRFALRAHTERELASTLDVRGELRIPRLEQAAHWTARLYAQLDNTDLSGWQRWIDYPIEIRAGRGGVRLWLGFSGKRLTEATADVALAQFAARLAPDLPLLELDYLEGRLGGNPTQAGFDLFGKHVALKTSGGVALPAADFGVSWEYARPERARSGSLQASALELQPLSRLAEFLPFPQDVRRRLAQIEPRGKVIDLKLTWAGEADRPERYSVRGRFVALGARAWNGVPAFSGLSGLLDGNEKGGTISVDAKNAGVELPGVLAGDKIQFDRLTARIGWSHGSDGVSVRIGNVALANRDLAGSLSGTFLASGGSPGVIAGVIDLTGSFSRLEGTSAYRVLPGLQVPVRDYLKSALRSGHAHDISLRLKGDLARFPFADAKQGTFQVVGKATGVDLNYAEHWPGLKGVDAELVLEGRAMRISASRAAVFGVRVASARATIADLFNDDEVLKVEAQADGPTAEYLRFVDASPVTGFIDGYTAGMRASGDAQLQLKLELPIRRLAQTKLAGSLRLASNRIVLDPDVPAFAQVNGRLEFTESGLRARALQSQFLGGPTALTVATGSDGTVSVSAQGNASVAAVRDLVDVPLLQYASGSAPWRGRIAFKRGTFELQAESSLQGVALHLPPPLGKAATEALPVRIARTNSTDSETLRRFRIRQLPPRGDAIMASVGRVLNAVLVRARDGKRMVIEHGALSFNELTPPLDEPGIVVTGSLPYLDLDPWRALLGELGRAGSAATAIPIDAVRLRIDELNFSGRQVHQLSLRATRSAGLWQAAVDARELAGDITWRPEGRGRIVARLRHLNIPASEQDAAPAPAEPDTASRELPALDLVADDFVVGDTRLGKLELVAVNQVRDRRIERLVLWTPEATLSADGYWQSWAAQPSTRMNVKLEVSDVGRYLERLGYPGTVRGGTAHLDGKLEWAGTPLAIDYPTLTGKLALKVGKGRFLKADPGAAKLLGILSLQSLLTFDLRDLFSEGFAFDTISSGARIARGVLTTRDFDMHGAAARVGMTGDIDLARETQNLRIRVMPALGDGAATAATLLLKINPITGLGALIAQRLFKDPLGQIFSLEYAVTGTWRKPKVEPAQVDILDPAEASW